MKFIISPSKTQNIKPSKLNQLPMFEDHANDHRQYLAKLGCDAFAEIAKVQKDKIKAVFDEMIQPTKTMEAIYAYTGLVYKQLSLDSYNQKQLDFIKNHVYIASAMYVVVNAFDHITNYRLDYTMRFNDYNLAKLNKPKIKEFTAINPTIISLASNEFNALFDPHEIIVMDFVVIRDGKHLRQSTQMKMIRGRFLDAIIKQCIDSFEELKELSIDDFHFCANMSNKQRMVYVREE